jgi:hypothetical protein
MRAGRSQLVGLTVLVLLLACNGDKGEKGDKGDRGEKGDTGPQGPAGPAGTFTGNFDGAATFSGPTEFHGTTRFNGNDLFNATMQGTYPAVLSSILSGSNYHCGTAPTDFFVDIRIGSSAAYGTILWSNQGQLTHDFHLLTNPCGTDNTCYGTITYFLKNRGPPKVISIPMFADSGPSYVYVDGNRGPNAFRTTALSGTIDASISIPSGNFALSFINCSTDGQNLPFSINNTFITLNGLDVHYDRTFHRNGM